MPTPPSFRGIVAIPARRASSRLPDKLLLSATGKPLLQHVVERCQSAARKSDGRIADVIVACDDAELANIAKSAGVRAVLTGSHHLCGTTRIAEAVSNLSDHPRLDFVVNVQGDEPEIAPEAILRVVELLAEDSEARMATLAVAMPKGSESHKNNPNAVKVVCDARGRALYFSRAPLPYDRQEPEAGEPLWRHHIGVYAYRKDFLFEFARMPASRLELREGLEQLRALEAGAPIAVGNIPAAWAAKGIDTLEDYDAFVRRAA
jgi:3-deoxy-manno-octulosonate cytidylyltransferase (CMP-KDO synthetase)